MEGQMEQWISKMSRAFKSKKHMKEYFNQQKYWLESGSIYDISQSAVYHILSTVIYEYSKMKAHR